MTPRKLLLPALLVITLMAVFVGYQQSRETGESMPDDARPDQQSASSDTASSADGGGSGHESMVNTPAATAGQRASDPDGDDGMESIADDRADSLSTAVAGSSDSSQARQPPDQSTPVLSDRVFYVIEEAQQRQLAGQWEASLAELNALYADFDSMSPFEQATLLNFYTNVLIRLEMWQESISAFTLMLTVDGLRPDLNARALIALGQLHQRVDERAQAAEYYQEWLAFTRGMPGLEDQTARVEQVLGNLQ